MNTITVHLKPETLVVNKCPLTVRLVETLDGEEVEESRERIVDLGPMDVGILVNRQVGGSSVMSFKVFVHLFTVLQHKVLCKVCV